MNSNSDDLNLQYTPSRWSKRYRAEEIVHKHIEFITNASKTASRAVPNQLSVPYGSSCEEKYDIFGINLPNDSPIVIYVNGGEYWQQYSRELSRYTVVPLYRKGFKVVVVGYDKHPDVSLEEMIKQVQRAFLNIINYTKVYGSSSLYVCGYSSGAHLVASIFQEGFMKAIPEEDQNLVRAVILISGIYDLGPLTKTHVNDSLKLELTEARRISPAFQQFAFSKNTLFFFMIGENDTVAYKNQSQSFHTKLKARGYTTDLITVNEVDHYDIAENMNEQNYEIVRLIVQIEEY